MSIRVLVLGYGVETAKLALNRYFLFAEINTLFLARVAGPITICAKQP